MKKCDNGKIHLTSNVILSIYMMMLLVCLLFHFW